MVGAGAVVASNVPPNAIVVGNPATITGYVETPRRVATEMPGDSLGPPASAIGVSGAQIVRLPKVDDLRGSLVIGEFAELLPFVPKRFFMVFDVPSRETRGEHAHLRLSQLLVCLRGECSLVLDDGRRRAGLVLNSPTVGFLFRPSSGEFSITSRATRYCWCWPRTPTIPTTTFATTRSFWR